MTTITLETDVGTVFEDAGQTGAYIVRKVKKPKTYSTHERAARFGNSRDPSPITMLDGRTRWIPLPFWRRDGAIYDYIEID